MHNCCRVIFCLSHNPSRLFLVLDSQQKNMSDKRTSGIVVRSSPHFTLNFRVRASLHFRINSVVRSSPHFTINFVDSASLHFRINSVVRSSPHFTISIVFRALLHIGINVVVRTRANYHCLNLDSLFLLKTCLQSLHFDLETLRK